MVMLLLLGTAAASVRKAVHEKLAFQEATAHELGKIKIHRR